MPCLWLLPNSDLKIGTYPVFATDTVRYMGDAVAVVVAETALAGARTRWSLIDVDYEPLSCVVDPEQATKPGAPQLHADMPGNRRVSLDGGGRRRRCRIRGGRGRRASERIIQQRLIPTAMETRGAVAQFSPATGELTLWNTTQNPHIVRFVMLGRDGGSGG